MNRLAEEKFRVLLITVFFSLLLSFFTPISSFALSTEDFVIDGYTLVNKQRVGRTAYAYTFRVNITNTSEENAYSVTAIINSKVPTIQVVENQIIIGDIPANGTISSGLDTFTVTIDRLYTFNVENVNWNIQFNQIAEEEDGGLPHFSALGSYPYAIPISKPTDILLTISQTGSDLKPTEVLVEEIDQFGNPVKVLGKLLDNGLYPDSTENDLLYSGNFNITSNTEGALYFRTKTTFPGLSYPIYSTPQKISVTRFPIDIQSSDLSKIVTDYETNTAIISNEVIVSFIDNIAPSTVQSIIEAIGGIVVGTIFDIGAYQIKIPDTNDSSGVNMAIKALLNYPEVAIAEPNFILYEQEITPTEEQEHSDKQWYLDRIGAYKAWDYARGNTKIAIIDHWFDYDHEDLKNRIVLGPDYYNYIDSEFWGNVGAILTGGKDHGTHVAGIIGAETNNGIGISGICWDCDLIGIKATTWHQIAAGISYAHSHGAKVINISMGLAEMNLHVKKAIDKAQDRNCLVVAAAGNNGCMKPFYPAAFKHVLAVAATNKNDQHSIWAEEYPFPFCTKDSGSNFGEWVDIAAPGDDIYSAVIGGYESKYGTSMAAPIVSGVAAVVRSQHPDWSERQVRYWLSITSKFDDGRVDFYEAVKDRDDCVCYYFKGEIKEAMDYGFGYIDDDFLPALPDGIDKKDKFRGIFCYDRNADLVYDYFPGLYRHNSVPYGVFLTIDPNKFGKDLNFRNNPHQYVWVRNNSTDDYIHFVADRFGGGGGEIEIMFRDYSGTALDDEDLPSKIKLDDWDIKEINIKTGCCNDNDECATSCYGYEIKGKIKELERLKF